ncbi:hypothetical protein KQY30_18530 [Streptomyces sp. GMY02]|uniref:hypothetical protein n=1 Tax=Streptomyces sp. GMY02 TaxID=1333528 RepID=UPI001C2BA6C2|nr:hypothetical protein [Streptomyces sp. GMY02]QXE35960.1 hypothetical protein KQY30_18530 [Streptomyces sp. GMY02]
MHHNSNNLFVDAYLADGRGVRLGIAAGDALVRQDGTIMQFSLAHADGSAAGNYILDEHGADAYDRAERIAKICLRYGLTLAEGRYLAKKGLTRPEHFAQYVVKHEVNTAVVDVLASWARKFFHHDDHGYYDMASQELVFRGVFQEP